MGIDGLTSDAGAGRIGGGAVRVGVAAAGGRTTATVAEAAGRAPCATIVRRGGMGSVESGMSRIATSAASLNAAVSAAWRSSAAMAVSCAAEVRARPASFLLQPATAAIAAVASMHLITLVIVDRPVSGRAPACDNRAAIRGLRLSSGFRARSRRFGVVRQRSGTPDMSAYGNAGEPE